MESHGQTAETDVKGKVMETKECRNKIVQLFCSKVDLVSKG